MIDSVSTKANLRKGLTMAHAGSSRYANRNTIKDSINVRRQPLAAINKDLLQVDTLYEIKEGNRSNSSKKRKNLI